MTSGADSAVAGRMVRTSLIRKRSRSEGEGHSVWYLALKCPLDQFKGSCS